MFLYELVPPTSPERKEISKSIRTLLKKATKARQNQRIATILHEFSGLKQIDGIRNNGKRHKMTSVRNKSGEVLDERQSIAEVFADFYEDLYESKIVGGNTDGTLFSDAAHKESANIPGIGGFVIAEVKEQLAKMSKGKASDRSGLVVEMLQLAGDGLLEALTQVFNDVLFLCLITYGLD